jgi:ABC-type sugar transport system permease subunit
LRCWCGAASPRQQQQSMGSLGKGFAAMLQRELRKLIWPFLLPSLVLYVVIGLWPTLEALYWSFTSYNGIAPQQEWIGLRNFTTMLNDRRWWLAVNNTFYFAVGTVVTLLPLALLFAILIGEVRYGRGIFKTLIFLPSILPIVIVAFLWSFFLDPTIGIFNEILRMLGIDTAVRRILGVNNLSWLTNPSLAKPTIIVIQLWQGVGFYMLIFLAGLAKIPRELFEAARIDGASGWRLFRSITWPLLFPTTQTVLLLLIINGLQIFTLVYALGGGGTASTQVMATYIYRTAFSDFRYGYATALSVCLMLIVFALTLISHRLTRREAVQF